jgi:hypothetical protein
MGIMAQKGILLSTDDMHLVAFMIGALEAFRDRFKFDADCYAQELEVTPHTLLAFEFVAKADKSIGLCRKWLADGLEDENTTPDMLFR